MREEKRVFALGFFDGVHLGHQALLRQCTNLASRLDSQTAVISFLRHPQAMFQPAPPALINTAQDRERLLRGQGVEYIRWLPVTKEVMGQPWQAFLQELLEDGAAGFVCGDDFRFGHWGEGDAEKLREFCKERGLPCIIVPEQTLEGVRISSTHIRKLIEQGQMETAARFLGHPHILSGKVVAGRQLGRTIGVPTANILIPADVAVPKLGVYACMCDIGGKQYPAVTNIGSRPTVGGHQTRAESWILDFEGDLYGRELTLQFHKFLREEKKFPTLEALQAEIRKNAEQTRIFFEKK